MLALIVFETAAQAIWPGFLRSGLRVRARAGVCGKLCSTLAAKDVH
jgi:hypothetical protein